MPSWVSQGVLMGSTGPAGPTGGQSTTTTANFTMPALNGTVAIAVVSAAWTRVGQVLFIINGASFGFWEITTRTSATALTLTNRGYAGNPTSGTMTTGAVVQLASPGFATATAPGFIPKLLSGAAALTTFSSFVIPGIGSGINITLGSVVDIVYPNFQLHYFIDATGNLMFGAPYNVAGNVVSYVNVFCYPGVGTTVAAGRVYMGFMPVLSDQNNVTVPAGGASLVAPPGYLNTLAPGSNIVLTPAPTAGGNVTISAISPGTSFYYDYDDFLGNPKFVTVGNSGGALAVSGPNNLISGAGHNGIIQLLPGTATANYARMYFGPFFLNTLATISLRAWIATNFVAAETQQVQIGFASAAGILAAANPAATFFLQLSSSTLWRAYTSNGSSQTNASTVITAVNSGWINLRVVLSTTACLFYVNDVLTNTISTTLPSGTQALFGQLLIHSNTNTANRFLFVDDIEIDMDNGLAGKFLKTPI